MYGESTCPLSSSSGASSVFFVAARARSSSSAPKPSEGFVRPSDLNLCIAASMSPEQEALELETSDSDS